MTKSCILSRYSLGTKFITNLLSVCMEIISKKCLKNPLFRTILTSILSTLFKNSTLQLRRTFFTRLYFLFVSRATTRQIVTLKMWPILPFPPRNRFSLKTLLRMSFLTLRCKSDFWPLYGKYDTVVARLLGVLDLYAILFLPYIIID